MFHKKLIEVALPLETINAEAAREKSIRHGHPSTLHLWWARRPLAAARAVIWASLVDDPSSHPELFHTEDAQNKERARLFTILEGLVKWENMGNSEFLKEARDEILKWTNGAPPALLDPFAGGGAIPLEAQRLGLEAHAHDLNPVAVMINKVMIEIPPRFAGLPPVHPKDGKCQVTQGAAGLAEDVRYSGFRNLMISTDPPYYDNIGYADLSDFFYVWLRQSLKSTFPQLFRTLQVPKKEELVATPYRFEGDAKKAKTFFEDGMFHTCQQIYNYSQEEIPVTIYYAYKQSDSAGDETSRQTASTGWETMLTAIIKAGFTITGTWPMRTEMANRSVASGTNALASSIVLVCRKRPTDAPACTRRNFVNELHRELLPALKKLQSGSIAPVDMAQSAIGPGMAVFSKYSQVLESNGTPMTVRNALAVINQELDIYFSNQDSGLDPTSNFCVTLYTQVGFGEIKFGEADTLARAKNISVEALADQGILFAEKGTVHLQERGSLPGNLSRSQPVWLQTQILTQAMETGGNQACADLMKKAGDVNPESARELAYRLYTIADGKGWTNEAYAYNSLIIAWPEIQALRMKPASEDKQYRIDM